MMLNKRAAPLWEVVRLLRKYRYVFVYSLCQISLSMLSAIVGRMSIINIFNLAQSNHVMHFGDKPSNINISTYFINVYKYSIFNSSKVNLSCQIMIMWSPTQTY